MGKFKRQRPVREEAVQAEFPESVEGCQDIMMGTAMRRQDAEDVAGIVFAGIAAELSFGGMGCFDFLVCRLFLPFFCCLVTFERPLVKISTAFLFLSKI